MPSPVSARDTSLPYTPYEPDEDVCRDTTAPSLECRDSTAPSDEHVAAAESSSAPRPAAGPSGSPDVPRPNVGNAIAHGPPLQGLAGQDRQDADYITISAGAGAVIGADVSLTLDRHGHLYVGLGAGVGVSATVASAAIMGGELARAPSGRPTEAELRSFLEGDSVGASVSAMAAGGVTNSAGGTAWEQGVGLVQAGAHFQHTWHLTEVPIRW
jgi:hypothetical protein